MTSQTPQSSTDPTATGHTELRVERTGTRRYVGMSSRGARVEIGSADVEGVFTPGELLKIALGACSAMASDFTVSRRLGDDYEATVHISGDADRSNERYPLLEERYELDMSELDPEAAAQWEQRFAAPARLRVADGEQDVVVLLGRAPDGSGHAWLMPQACTQRPEVGPIEPEGDPVEGP